MTSHRMKWKRILALLGIVILAGLYLTCLLFAVIDHPQKASVLSASLYATVVIPALLYVFLFVARLFKKYRNKPEDNDSSGHSASL